MRVIKNKLIPFKGFKAINLFGVIFHKGNLTQAELQHEHIHSAQIAEVSVAMIPIFLILAKVSWGLLLLWFFSYYIWYLIEFLIRWAQYKDRIVAYKNISFEREAYSNQNVLDYLRYRRVGNFLNYIKTKK